MKIRHPRLTALAAGAMLLLGSATGGSTADASAPPTSDPAAPASDASFPVTIEHAYGTLVLDEAPERVVTLGWLESDVAVALGVEPIAVAEFPFTESLLSPWLEERLAGSPETIETAGQGTARADLNYELLATLEPDLIIASTYIDLANQYGRLTEIAPVLGPSVADYSHIPWQEQTLAIGDALGQSAAAAALVDGTEALVVTAVDDHPGLAGLTYSLSLGTPDALRIVQDPEDAGLALLDRFGLVISPALAELPSLDDGSGGTAVSEENVAAIDADIVIVAYLADEIRTRWESSPIFSAIPAVADGRYVAVDPTALSALRNPSPLSVPYAIQTIVIDGAVAVSS